MSHFPLSFSLDRDFEITGTGVVLTPIRPSDSPDNYRWDCDDELAALNGRAPLNISYVDYLSATADNPPRKLLFAIRTRTENRHIGNAALFDFDRLESEATLGIYIAEPQFRRRGFGTDAIRTLVSFAFFQLGLTRLQLKTLAKNQAALTCFHKCGFLPSGTLIEDGQRFLLMHLLPQRFASWQQPKNEGIEGN